jgi:hypothetical protein
MLDMIREPHLWLVGEVLEHVLGTLQFEHEKTLLPRLRKVVPPL